MSDDAFIERAKIWDKHPELCRIADEFAAEVEKIVTFGPEDVVMDFGCGTGQVGLRFSTRVRHMVMLDTSAAMLAVLGEKLERNHIDNVEVISKPLPGAELSSGQMDTVFTSMALHHVENLGGLFNDIHGLLKPEGRLILGELLPEDGSYHGDEIVPHHGFNPESLKLELEENGFSVSRCYEHGVVNKPGKDSVLRQYGKFVLEARKA
ncbi:class I SAM-dependent methyltransferase [Maridesulfovibrio sp. FT414]|uniref:class I SAM-dependent methyltransferase n=1 Tax=Maridesulfovibrio sp. FT414 TaxID=2979469 RepID=UPI003D800418